LKLVLHKVIGDKQSTFLKNRVIGSCVSSKWSDRRPWKEKRKIVIIKADFEKAYDSELRVFGVYDSEIRF